MRTKGLLLVMSMISTVVKGAQIAPEVKMAAVVVTDSNVPERSAPLISFQPIHQAVLAAHDETAVTPSEEKDVKVAISDEKHGKSAMRVINVKPGHRRTRSAPPRDLVRRKLSPIKEEDAAEMLLQNYFEKPDITKRFYQLVCGNELVALRGFLNLQSRATIDFLVGNLYGVDDASILHCAIRSVDCQADEKNAVITYLITEVGVNFCAQDSRLRMPLHTAVLEDRLGMVGVLIKAIKDQKDSQVNYLDAQDKDGKTPLHLAVFGGYADIVKELIAGGAWVDAQDKDGKTPLHYAVSGGYHAISDFLVTNNANVNLIDKVGDTPLHAAARIADGVVITYLLAGNAKVAVKNNRGETPFDIAVYTGMSRAILELLRPSCCGDGCCCVQ
jgi:ankyrin repeat protein